MSKAFVKEDSSFDDDEVMSQGLSIPLVRKTILRAVVITKCAMSLLT